MSKRAPARPLDPSGFSESDRRRFWIKVDIGGPAGCWNWTAGLSAKGYGKFGWCGSAWYAHRWSYALHTGAPVPTDLVIDHLCRNPACVNPSHMEAVTHEENISRGTPAMSKITHCPQGHEYTPENTCRYQSSADGKWRRQCRACSREKQRKVAETEEYKAAQREYRRRTREQRRAYEQANLADRRAKWAENAAKLTDEERAERNAKARERYRIRQAAKKAV
jgi:hypothetical protein